MLSKASSVLPILTLLLGPCSSANILVLHPLHGGSHKIQLEHLSNQLVTRGHSITSVSFANVGHVAPKKNNYNNITRIVLTVKNNSDGRYPYITRDGLFEFPNDLMWSGGQEPHSFPLDALKTTEGLCRSLLGDSRLLDTLRTTRFQLALVDVISNECGLALARVLNVHKVVAYWPMFPTAGEMDYTAGSFFQPPSYVPSFLSGLAERMSFPERMYNAYLRLCGWLVMEVQFHLAHHYIQEYFPGSPHPKELIANLSGILLNSDFVLDYPKLMPPNVVSVACLQCSAKDFVEEEKIPRDLQDWLNEAGSGTGVILFSLGASFDASVSTDLLAKLFDAFSRLQQRVLMKIAKLPKDQGLKVPGNVRIVSWLPQLEVLAHPNVKLFFTHCGLSGVNEAIWHGVPMVGMPIFGDQFDVIVRLRDRGLATQVAKGATADQVYQAVVQVLGDQKFAANAKKYQRLLRDQKQLPMDRAIWFIEYLLRNGAEHLKMGSRHLSWVQLYCLDLAAAFAAIGLLITWILSKFLRFLCCFIYRCSIGRRRGQRVRNKVD